MEAFPEPVSKSSTKIIYEQMSNCFYKIDMKDGNYELGCFINIKRGDNLYPVLITNINVLKHIHNNSINILTDNGLKKIVLGNIRYQDKTYNICLLQIIENKKDNIHYMDIDEDIYKSEIEVNYCKKSIYIIQHDNKKDTSVSYGKINEIINKEMLYSSNINTNSNLSIIFNLISNKIIGINGYRTKYYHKGIFINYMVKK